MKNKRAFDIIAFERTVDDLKQCVTEHLWRVAVEDAQLMHQIKLIKDFFLLGRGELFLEFIRLAGHILNKKPTSHTTRDINLSFQIAARKMHFHDESTTESFDFVVPVPEAEIEASEEVEEDAEFSRKEREDPIGKFIQHTSCSCSYNDIVIFRFQRVGLDPASIQSCLAAALAFQSSSA